MKTIYLRLTVPDDVDPEEVVETMAADFFYSNRGAYEERFPDQDVMANINLNIVNNTKVEQGEIDVWANHGKK